MPSIGQVVSSAIPAGMSLAEYLASRRSLNNATATVNAGATTAATGLNTAAQRAIDAQNAALGQQRTIATASTGRTDTATAAGLKAQEEALAEQKRLHDETVAANAPYSATGTQGIAGLQKLIDNPNSVTEDPGYKFGMEQSLKGVERTAAANGTVGNGGQYARATRQALDFATTKYNDAWNRLMQSVGVGERANSANASAGVTLGNQTQANANNVTDINRTGANANNLTDATLGTEIGANANNVGEFGTRNAENQAALTLAQAELAAKNEGLKGNNTVSTIGTIASQVPTILKALGIGGSTAAAGAGTAGAATGAAAGTGTAATGVTGTLGLGGGSGLFGLGAATIPVVGGIIAGGALLANHFIGQGRKAADKLTGQDGIQHAFEETLSTIDSQPGYTEAQKWESKVQAYAKLKELALEFAKKGENERKVASQMFDTIAHLFGETNPLKGTA